MNTNQLWKSHAGFTLVEVLVTLGIASIMMTGILELVNISQRATRNVTTNADWNNLQSLIRNALSLETNCQAILGQISNGATHNYTYDGTTFRDPAMGATLNQIQKLQSVQSGITLVDTTANSFLTFTLDKIIVAPLAGTQPVLQTLTYTPPLPAPQVPVTKSFWVYQVQMTLNGTKKAVPGSPSSLGGNNLTTNIPISVSIITGPAYNPGTAPPSPALVTANNVYSCYGSQSGPEAACAALGGAWVKAGDIVSNGAAASVDHCVIANATNFDSAQRGAAGQPSGVSQPGARLTLYSAGSPGNDPFENPTSHDYSIGVNDQQMWFNIGGNASYFGNPGSTNVNSYVWASMPDPTGLPQSMALMALDSKGQLVLNSEGWADDSVLAFSLSKVGGNTVPTPNEKIVSSLGLEDLEFWTAGNANMALRQDGILIVGQSQMFPPNAPRTTGEIAFWIPATTVNGPAGFDETNSARILGDVGDVGIPGKFGSLYLAARDSSGTVPASPAGTPSGTRLALNSDGTNVLYGKGPLFVNGTNNLHNPVPYGCWWNGNGGLNGTAKAPCNPNETAVGGGGWCGLNGNPNSAIIQSMPVIGTPGAWTIYCSDTTDTPIAWVSCCVTQ